MDILAGRYEIIKVLGGGGFAVAFLAQDNLQPSKPLCVVKQLRPNQTHPRVIEFFEKEAAILERLGKHPQIPQLLAHFTEQDNLYIVQEFIEGQDLSKEITFGKKLSEGYVSKLLEDVLGVLSFVHQQGVIHRDIKPQNLMRQRPGGRIFLIDFGAVKELGTLMLNTQGEIASSVVIGTGGYMPNEQKNGKPCLGSDVYAVGMTVIQALTGILPFDLPEDPQTGEIIWRQEAPQISDNLAEVISKMVRRHFSLRYSSAITALEALSSIVTPVTPIAPTVTFDVAKQEYTQEAVIRAQQGQGTFSVFALRILESKRVELGLLEDEAREIQAQVLQPYRDYQRKLQEYEQALVEAVKLQYPFSAAVERDLQDYRQYLGLRDDDIRAIEQRVLVPHQGGHQQQEIAERQRQQAELQRQQEIVQQQKQQAEARKRQQQQTPANNQIQTQQFEFEVATITNVRKSGFMGWGKTCDISYTKKRAEFFREDLGNGVGLEMVAIPGGTFLMGSPDNEQGHKSDESPQHKVTIQPFFMGKFAVTQAQYQAIMGNNPASFKGENRPVERVSWDDAVEFCKKISQKTGRNYRLPNEAEWEYACRAGTTTPFCFGETITTDLANYGGVKTTEVGKFPPNAFGLYDVHGNVWEWCQDDWNNNYNGAPTDGSACLTGNDNRKLLRGGSWFYFPAYCRSAFRVSITRDNRYDSYGFRLVFSA
ncbi:bifunctional serine/threonine-protein kinase/formylglycine-generating enzyme family protein [Calothrix sp. PCC 6303]|uniref:bifunctional serine/threonine-protein kinase/formylglycine-generating enzyme family protein n=1 Tax=Calothrix sp. PCC 6303 TaxID=1170562 RepID=UPI0002A02EF3|nr:bifunctional serine/threonine-protein kinase/formylglycine-generating enzyme family protein [Calothrix sp. PCC 6303]AFZ00791.1 serine/threonine protein kinase [Calothrix sp. PCC 6303]